MAADRTGETQRRFGVMLVSLLLLLLITPFMSTTELTFTRFLIGILFSLVLVAAVYTLSTSKQSLFIACGLGVPALALHWAESFTQNHVTVIAAHILAILFLAYAVALILRYLLTTRHVTADTIFASLCAYLLLGIGWAEAYSLVDVLQPGSFHFALADDPDVVRMQYGGGSYEYGLYYSFVTLTTLGYGDIVPVTGPARLLATLQAVAGQIFLTVLVARLVALHIAHSGRGVGGVDK